MTTEYGVTATGFVKKPLSVIKAEVEESLKSEIRPDLNFLASGPLGQIVGVLSDKIREAWDVMEAVYSAFYPDSATAASLDGVASLTGAVRLPATKSTVPLDQLFLEDGKTITAGSVVSVGAGARFVLLEDVSNSSGATATVSGTAESEDFGPIVGNAETIDTIQTPISGWSAAAAVSGTAFQNFNLDGLSQNFAVDGGADQNVTFSGTSLSAAAVATQIEAQTTGIDAYDDGLGRIRIASETEGTGSSINVGSGAAYTVLGLSRGTVKGFNTSDATPGRNLETDPDFRIRRENLLRSTGSATVEAILAALLGVEDVVQVIFLENTSDVVNEDGLPPHSFEAIVRGGDDQDIADTIWDKKAAGIKSAGSVAVTVTDSQGVDHTIQFTRATEVRLYMEYTLTVDSDLYPSDGDQQVKDAAAAFALTLGAGDDAIALEFRSVALTIAGVIDVPTFKIDTVTPPVGTSNISITQRQLVTLDSDDVTVVIP